MSDLDTALGLATCTSLLQEAIITKMIMRGIFSKEEIVEMIDAGLLVLERHRPDGDGPGFRAIDHARVRLEGLMTNIQAIRLPEI